MLMHQLMVLFDRLFLQLLNIAQLCTETVANKAKKFKKIVPGP